MERAARPDEIVQIKAPDVRGGRGRARWDGQPARRPITSATRGVRWPRAWPVCDELVAYASVLKELGRGIIEFNLNVTGNFTDDDYQILDALLTASGRPVTWLAVFVHNHKEVLAKAEPLVKRGGIPQVSAVPVVRNVDLRTPGSFAALPTFGRVLNKPLEVMQKEYADPTFHEGFRRDLSLKVARPDLKRMRVEEVQTPRLEIRTKASQSRRSRMSAEWIWSMRSWTFRSPMDCAPASPTCR